MTTYYLIRHAPTGRLLPARVLATHYEFDQPEGTHEPRLFKSERAAKNCATCWARGEWRQSVETESDGWEHPSYTYLAEPTPTAVSGRKREDLEVVAATLEIANAS